MSSIRTFWFVVMVALILNGCARSDPFESDSLESNSASAGHELPLGRVIASLSVSENTIGISHTDQEDALPFGPAGLFAIKDGFVIPDNVNHTVHVLNGDMTYRDRVDTSKFAVGITAAVQLEKDVVLLDSASVVPALLTLGPDGSISRLEMATDEKAPPSGLKVDDGGVLVEFDGGARLYRTSKNDNSLRLIPVEGYTWNGMQYSIDLPVDPYGNERIVRIGEHATTISVPNMLGSARILGLTATGDLYIVIEDVAFLPEVTVEETVWRLDSTGHIVNVARVPLENSEIGESFGLVLGHDDEPIAMMTGRSKVEFWSLNPVAPEPILHRSPTRVPQGHESGVGVASSALQVAGGGCLTSSQMLKNINEYGNVYRYLSSSNISNSTSCSGREAPSYLGSAGYYSSVSYDWGGFDTPTQFINAMSSGYKAGNMNTSYVLGCSYGVDCSGFVSRVWGLTTKLSTSSIPSYSRPAYGPAYVVGEVFNYPGVHVVIFAGGGANGIYAYESTALSNLDRVAYTYRTWASLSGYTARHPNTMC